MNEQFCKVGEIELCYEEFGEPSNPAVLMIMGLGTQMIGWPREVCSGMAAVGFHVIRFDNRDVGRSTSTEGRPPGIRDLLMRPRRVARYTLDDLADDTTGLLDHLGIETAHVVGASMGGMIAQQLAARHPGRVLSLASIMSTTGSRRVGQPKPGIYRVLARRPKLHDREAVQDNAVTVFKAIGSPGFPFDEEMYRMLAGISYDRGGNPFGVIWQLAAIQASGNRTRQIRTITAPTVVLHGEEDPLIRVSGGRATAAAIADSRLVTVPGWGHDLPRELLPQIGEEIFNNMQRAKAPTDSVAA